MLTIVDSHDSRLLYFINIEAYQLFNVGRLRSSWVIPSDIAVRNTSVRRKSTITRTLSLTQVNNIVILQLSEEL
ncbi:MAG: hypothetical protein R3F50_19835 [Gammaproteobacteria bacterium]